MMRLRSVGDGVDDGFDVLKVMMHRPEFFGAPYRVLLHDVMRGPSTWTAGERELFAAFTSRLNQCPF
jgi:hypothetical protein